MLCKYKNCLFVFCFDIQNNICTQHVLNLYFLGDSMNNLSSYCGLTDSKMRASDTDLPVKTFIYSLQHPSFNQLNSCIISNSLLQLHQVIEVDSFLKITVMYDDKYKLQLLQPSIYIWSEGKCLTFSYMIHFNLHYSLLNLRKFLTLAQITKNGCQITFHHLFRCMAIRVVIWHPFLEI